MLKPFCGRGSMLWGDMLGAWGTGSCRRLVQHSFLNSKGRWSRILSTLPKGVNLPIGNWIHLPSSPLDFWGTQPLGYEYDDVYYTHWHVYTYMYAKPNMSDMYIECTYTIHTHTHTHTYIHTIFTHFIPFHHTHTRINVWDFQPWCSHLQLWSSLCRHLWLSALGLVAPPKWLTTGTDLTKKNGPKQFCQVKGPFHFCCICMYIYIYALNAWMCICSDCIDIQRSMTSFFRVVYIYICVCVYSLHWIMYVKEWVHSDAIHLNGDVTLYLQPRPATGAANPGVTSAPGKDWRWESQVEISKNPMWLCFESGLEFTQVLKIG